jgi:hypothetical protein
MKTKKPKGARTSVRHVRNANVAPSLCLARRWCGLLALATVATACQSAGETVDVARLDATLDATLDSAVNAAPDSAADTASERVDQPDALLDRDVSDSGSECAPLAPNGCPLTVPPASLPVACDNGCNAAHAEQSCEYERARCRCVLGAGYRWMCEPIECPANGPTAGAACTTADLMCARRFEDPGYRCVASEGVWVRCEFIRTLPSSPQSLHCPPRPPTANALCCVLSASASPPPRECRYSNGDGGSETWDCVNNHWTRIAP